MVQNFASVDDYIATVTPDVQTVLQAIRDTIHAAAPGATESMSYQIRLRRRRRLPRWSCPRSRFRLSMAGDIGGFADQSRWRVAKPATAQPSSNQLGQIAGRLLRFGDEMSDINTSTGELLMHVARGC